MQLSLWFWDFRVIDLAEKIKAEKEAGVEVFYHFRGRPLLMRSPNAG